MEREYWYIGVLSAEETTETVVHLTESEHKAVQKFLNQLESKGYCGDCSISDTPYETKEACRIW